MELKPLINLCRRLRGSPFKTFLLHNRMCIQCYDIAIDSDIGSHYILHIPDTEEYADPFYDKTVVFDAVELLELYRDGHSVILERKKKESIKPKEVKEFCDVYVSSEGHLDLKLQFVIRDELVATKTYRLPYPVNPYDPMVANITNTFDKIFDKCKVGGYTVTADAIYSGFYYIALNNQQISYVNVRVFNKVVKVPLFKSLLCGVKSPDRCIISVTETEMNNIYLYSLLVEKNGLTHTTISYLQNF